jgi:hypothetical protein
MATRYALLRYTAPDGKTYDPGDKIDVDMSTDKDKADDARQLADRVYAKTKPAGVSNRPSARGEQETS